MIAAQLFEAGAVAVLEPTAMAEGCPPAPSWSPYVDTSSLAHDYVIVALKATSVHLDHKPDALMSRLQMYGAYAIVPKDTVGRAVDALAPGLEALSGSQRCTVTVETMPHAEIFNMHASRRAA